jgi:Ca-activated chloride channel family protein
MKRLPSPRPKEVRVQLYPNRWLGTGVFLAAVAVFAVILIGWQPMCRLAPWLPGCGAPAVPPSSTQPAAPKDAVVVDFHSAITKQDWIDAVTATFNAAGLKTGAGNPIFVRVTHVTSGGSKDAILAGSSQATAWSPGDQSWVDQANVVWQDRSGHPLVSGACPPTVYAPIGFALWRPMAEAMGWPDQPIGWDEIVALAADPQGWARYGRPQWGQFTFGHPHARYSNFGMLMVAQIAYATLNMTEGLTLATVNDPAVVEAMRHLEAHTYRYGEQSRNLLDLMALRGTPYLHAVFTAEAETLKANRDHAGDLEFPLAFVFPAEGTSWTEQPYCVLDGAEWVSDEQQEAAEIYGAYLQAPEQQAQAVSNYLRPVNPALALGCPICLEQGTDAAMTPAVIPALASPTGETAQALIDLYLLTKKKATVVLVLDISGSMHGDKLRGATEAAARFIERLEPEDEVVVVAFNSEPAVLAAPGLARDVAEDLAQTVRELIAGGGTALYDGICQATELVSQLRARHDAAADPRLYGIVVLSDGQDSGSQKTLNTMLATCLPASDEVEGVKVFTIAYGSDAEVDLLARIANRTNGRSYPGDPATIESVYKNISAEQ